MAENAATPRASGDQAPQSDHPNLPHMRSHRKMDRTDGLFDFIEYYIDPLDCLANTLRDAGSDQAAALVSAIAGYQRHRLLELESIIRRDVGGILIEGADSDVTSPRFATLAPPRNLVLHLLHEDGDEQYSTLAEIAPKTKPAFISGK